MTGVFLVIDGPDMGQSFRIDADQVALVGRDASSDFQINDPYISRSHFKIEALDGKTRLSNCSQHGTVVNRLSVQEHELQFGDVICIGETRIEFKKSDSNKPSERVFKRNELKTVEFGDAAARLEILSILPKTIFESRSDEDLAVRLSALLLTSIPDANAAAAAIYLIGEDDNNTSGNSNLADFETPRMMQSCTRDGHQFQPSRRLVARTFEEGESVLHVWSRDASHSPYTMSPDVDWAFCTPIQGEACGGWCFYVSGKLALQAESAMSSKLLGHLRFTELVAQFIGAVRHVQLLQSRQSTMQQFFSPRVIETLSGEEAESVLKPREGIVSVLFCDVHGFSHQVEKSEHQLQYFLDRVSEALGVMTHAVMHHEGVIADFQGDAVLAFWGWPAPLDEGPLPACRAALEISKQFLEAERSEDHPLNGFSAGIGIGFGRAIAGKIGTRQQSKVGVFGSVVNVASRLEGIAKQLHVPILLDEAAATAVREHMSATEARCRTLGRYQPKGMQQPVQVNQLLPPVEQGSLITDEYIAEYERAVHGFFEGNWTDSLAAFDGFPSHDRAAEILIRFAEEHGGVPPMNWNGVVPLKNK